MHLGDNSILSCLGLGKDSVVSIALVQLRLDSKVVAVTKYDMTHLLVRLHGIECLLLCLTLAIALINLLAGANGLLLGLTLLV